jgi:hypothetical protein
MTYYLVDDVDVQLHQARLSTYERLDNFFAWQQSL